MYLHNTWYVCGWSDNITRTPIVRTLCNQEILLYRGDDGRAVAMSNRCPHRFVELHLGHVIGDRIQCPYHGLQFDSTGACVHNPHGTGAIPKAAQLRRYPLVERHNAVWIWMGHPDRADADLIPDFSLLSDRTNYATVFGYLKINANYRLVADNLLDLGHVEFIHPMLGTPGTSSRSTYTSSQQGNTVSSQWSWTDEPVTPIFQLLWSKANRGHVECFEFVQRMQWHPPSNLFLDIWSHRKGEPREQGVSLPGAHLLAPETDMTTHYFWAVARNCALDDTELDHQVHSAVDAAFINEDAPMIESQQSYLRPGTDLLSYKPILLGGDAGAIRARRVLDELIADEQKSLTNLQNMAETA